MYNNKNSFQPTSVRSNTPRPLNGRSRPMSPLSGGISDLPDDPLEERMGERTSERGCDGTLRNSSPATDHNGYGWGLLDHPLAMVYAPYQFFREVYSPDVALNRGTMFAELDLPFEGDKKRMGGCC